MLQLGPASHSDAELLSLLLRKGERSKSTKDLALELLRQFGGLSGLLRASSDDLKSSLGGERAKIATLLAVRELALRLWQSTSDESPPKISSGADAYRLFSDLALENQEVVSVALLNSRNVLIRKKEIFRGTLVSSPAGPREILREALSANAARFLIAHNHPSENPEPSADDISLTKQLEIAAQTVGIPMLDHLIVCTGGKYFSFAESNLLFAEDRSSRRWKSDLVPAVGVRRRGRS